MLDKDIREEIGVIRLKAASGSKEPVFAAYISGSDADAVSFLKEDLLRVDTVSLTADSYARAGLTQPTVDELLKLTENDPLTWEMYAKGYTMGLNQVEKDKTREKVMRYKPKNIVELTYFVAAVRPGFASMVNDFISRKPFSYGIKRLDNLLQTPEMPYSFLVMQEQILTILKEGGVSPADAYQCIKAISKKKPEKIAKHKETFEQGFMKKLVEEDGVSEKEAKAAVDKIWGIISDSASYSFNASHAYSVACDSLYSAYLKAHYPYEFYVTLLELYASKGDKDRIALACVEMQRAFGIRMTTCKFRQDNRSYMIDKDNHAITDALQSCKHLSKRVADALYAKRDKHYETFVDLLYDLSHTPAINATAIEILIKMGYFEEFGQRGKLLDIWGMFKSRYSKSLVQASQMTRLGELRAYEANALDKEIDMSELASFEVEHFGTVKTLYPDKKKSYVVISCDDKYSPKVQLCSLSTGKVGTMKVHKATWKKSPLISGDTIEMLGWEKRQAYQYQNGSAVAKQGVFDLWLTSYTKQNLHTDAK